MSSLYGKLVTDSMNYVDTLAVQTIRNLTRLADYKLSDAQKKSDELDILTEYGKEFDEHEVKKVLADLIHDVVDIENLLDTAGSMLKYIKE